MEKQYLKKEGIILRVDKSDGSNPKSPKAFFYFDENGKEDKYTCWSETLASAFKEGDEVVVLYVIQENSYNGRIYKNKVISNIEFKNKGNVQLTEDNKKLLEDIGYRVKCKPADIIIRSENGVIKMGGLYYRVKELEVELIQNKGEDEI